MDLVISAEESETVRRLVSETEETPYKHAALLQFCSQIRQPGLARRLSLGPTSSAESEEEPRPDGGRRIDLPGQTEPITNFPLVLAKDMAFVYVLECLLSTK